jgi:hypothetical protein
VFDDGGVHELRHFESLYQTEWQSLQVKQRLQMKDWRRRSSIHLKMSKYVNISPGNYPVINAR